MDRSKLLLLVDKIKARGYSYNRETVLTIEEYFDGNDEAYSTICANNARPPSAQALREYLLAIRAKPSVSDVLVLVYEFEDALEYQDTWITSDTVYVITSASVREVEEWFRPLTPSDVSEETRLARFNNLPVIGEGSRLVAVWWD
jgi:hypothetical protein